MHGTPYVPYDEFNVEARGLGTTVAFCWERMRNICPKVSLCHGPIVQKDGSQCLTPGDLNDAMLATRDFWFEPPVQDGGHWAPVLDSYRSSKVWPRTCFSLRYFTPKTRPQGLMAYRTLLGNCYRTLLWTL